MVSASDFHGGFFLLEQPHVALCVQRFVCWAGYSAKVRQAKEGKGGQRGLDLDLEGGGGHVIGVSHWDFSGDYVNLSVGHVTLNCLNSVVTLSERFRVLTPNEKKPELVIMICDLFDGRQERKKKCTCTAVRGGTLCTFGPV